MQFRPTVLLLALAGLAPQAQAQARFSLTPLGDLGGGHVVAKAVNDAGQVVGTARLADDGSRAFVYTQAGGMSELPTLGSVSSAVAIASNGLILGTMGVRAFVYEAGVAHAFGPERLQPIAINAQGAVLATADDQLRLYGRNGSFQALPTMGGSGSLSFGRALNDQGVVVGFALLPRDSFYRAFSYDQGVMHSLGDLGNRDSKAAAINNAGLIVGGSSQAYGRLQAFIYREGVVHGLATPSGDSRATAISSTGAVGGEAYPTGAIGSTAVIWTDGGQTMARLNTLVTRDWRFESVAGITASDQVVVNGIFQGRQQAAMLALHPDWQGGDGRWDDAAHWNYSGLGTLGHAPGQAHEVVIHGGAGSATILGSADGRARSLSLSAAAGQQLLFRLNGGSTRTQSGTVINAGVVLEGSGRLEGGLTVQPGATVQLGAGEAMSLGGGGVAHSGVLKVLGTAQAPAVFSNSAALNSGAGSQIKVEHGNLNFAGGLVLEGRMSFSHGNVSGPVQVLAGGQLLADKGSNTFNDLLDVSAGAELRISQGSSATFFGPVVQRTGALFSGSGPKHYEGGLSIGDSPGLGVDAGNVGFGAANLYLAELGGASACTLACGKDEALRNRSFDKYIVNGHLSFGGTLKLASWQGFSAQAGQSFDLFDWGSSSGSFERLDASDFAHAAGTVLDFSRLYSTGEVRVLAVPEPASQALWLAGLGGLAAWAARRRRLA